MWCIVLDHIFGFSETSVVELGGMWAVPPEFKEGLHLLIFATCIWHHTCSPFVLGVKMALITTVPRLTALRPPISQNKHKISSLLDFPTLKNPPASRE